MSEPASLDREQSSVVLQITGLSYRYGDHVAVNSLDLKIETGSFFGFLGPNGAGKTTTIECIAGLKGDWAGEMLMFDQPYAPATNVDDRRRIGLVPQDIALYDDLTAKENLFFFGQLAGLGKVKLRDRVNHALALAGLEERANDRAGQFSGGMKRRLNLAIGQLHEPELLLLDEPTAGVDPQSRSHLFEALKSLNRAGTTIMYTTHYMEEVEKLCDRIAIMNAGNAVAVGTAAELSGLIGDPNANLETVFLELTGHTLRD
ncbi:ABC transporter ATP-binding protein [Rubripirellula amarantea]|uniref:ABC transporter ATP-binding protein n=1 Tax=Rubripirellula amarantea TaxID=2527999 RepID=UPI001A94EB59|nr:ABC transporter ATP-binding protein [Rubripirellula amarantea]